MARPTSPQLIDETVEMILDTGNALTAVLAETMPFEDLDRLLWELTAEILDVYRTVADEQELEGAGR